MTVFHTIVELLRFKPSTSYAEIASVTRMKKIAVLQTLNKNNHLLIMGRDGKIVGLRAVVNGVLYASNHGTMFSCGIVQQQWQE